ncbi:MAG: hypothetical protein ABIY37_02455, partial [Devosia sp.]
GAMEDIMGEGSRRILGRLMAVAAMAVALAATMLQAPQAAEPPGYWQCEDSEWLAVGEPEHPQPLIACCGTGTGEAAVTPELCEKAGGIWGPIGLFPEPVCTQRTIDAGRYCADMGECAASCDAQLSAEEYQQMLDGELVLTGGICSGATPLIGCHAMVSAGKVDGMLCID